MQPLVSIICLAYNHEKFINQALAGFVMQKVNFTYEIIIHDDASTDNTVLIIKDYERKYPKLFRPIYQIENQASKERGRVTKIVFGAAKGKYIALCEGDDYWTDPLKLQKQVDFLEKNEEFSGCFHDTYIKRGNSFSLWRKYSKEVFDITDTISTRALLHTSSFLFVSKHQYLSDSAPKSISGDMVLFAQIANRGKLKRIPEVMSVYRKHAGGITQTKTVISNFHKDRIILMNFLNKELKYKYTNEVEKVISYHKKQIKSKNKNYIFIQTLKQKIRLRTRIKAFIKG